MFSFMWKVLDNLKKFFIEKVFNILSTGYLTGYPL